MNLQDILLSREKKCERKAIRFKRFARIQLGKNVLADLKKTEGGEGRKGGKRRRAGRKSALRFTVIVP